ncbi:MAG: hypothetical protein COA79_26540 [Planctomycetota bacterium]|nr:MAG: hypothetical protein COA79_26540 [Planctomycetota bacterium]
MNKFKFSLIELFAVIIVILILSTLLMPSIKNIRSKAREAICINQLKQIGTLISTYTNDYDGYLPFAYGNNSPNDGRHGRLYGYWTGHLLPYMNFELKSWDKLRNRYDIDTDDIERPSAAVSDENYRNWRLSHDMFFEGGHGPLKLFICPESVNTYEPSRLPFGEYIPRIHQMGSDVGLPSSYTANVYFSNFVLHTSTGRGPTKRLEDVDGRKFLIAEGNRVYSTFNTWGFRTNFNEGGTTRSGVIGQSLFSFMHDESEELWYSDNGNVGWRNHLKLPEAQRFNKLYNPYAGAYRGYRGRGQLTSNQYPGENWENFMTPEVARNKFKIARFYPSETQMASYFGSMHLLTANLSVNKRHITWMYANVNEISQNKR